MHDDDRPVGYVLTRREVIALMAGAGMVMLTGGRVAPGSSRPIPGCVVRPRQTEGPYFIDDRLDRSDIRTDPADGTRKPGIPLDLRFNVSRMAGPACAPLAGAMVDVWQCDHLGVYSDVRDPSFNTVGKKFLRGYQTTDAGGVARFTTIFPGWYAGRTVHIHFKIRSAAAAKPGFEFTSQIYFDDAETDRILAKPPYAAKGPRTVKNAGDGIFRRDGAQLIVPITAAGEGYAGTFDIALQTA